MPWILGRFSRPQPISKAARRIEAARAQQRARERQDARDAERRRVLDRQRASWERIRSDMTRKHLKGAMSV